jgi:hypothetical protein
LLLQVFDRVDVGTGREQQLDCGRAAGARRRHESRLAFTRGLRQIGAAIQQGFDRRSIAVAACLEQRRYAEVVGDVWIRACFDEQPDELGRTLVCRPQHCGRAVRLGSVDVRARRDELANLVDIGVAGRARDRSRCALQRGAR